MRNIVLLILLSIAFCITEGTLTHFLPNAATDFDVWLKYFIAKDAVYDAMFFVFSLLIFWNIDRKNNLQIVGKCICIFLVFVTGGSFIDKVIFDLNQYLISDIFLMFWGFVMSVTLYRKWKI